jgi:hypothetical protein
LRSCASSKYNSDDKSSVMNRIY